MKYNKKLTRMRKIFSMLRTEQHMRVSRPLKGLRKKTTINFDYKN